MIESDYIMRMINQLTQAIVNLFKLKAEKDYPKAFTEINRASKQTLGMELSLMDSFSDSQVLEFFGKDPNFAPSRWYVVGVLLKERAGLERETGSEEKAQRSEERALNLLLEAYFSAGPVVEKEHREHLEALIARCGDAGFSREQLLKVVRYYEESGELAKAEDMMLNLLAASPGDAPLVKAFYARQQEKPDPDLERGGLSRTRILEQLEDL